MPEPSPTRARTRPVGGSPVRPHHRLADPSDTRRNLRVSVGILIGLLLFGAAGFVVLGDNRSLFEALYVTVVILTTVGMKEGALHLNNAEQGWAMVLMLAGISTALYAAGNLVAFFVEGDLRHILGRRQLQKQIDKLSDHFVVCGFGRMGRALCEALANQGAAFVLIESDSEKTAIADDLGYLYIHGDAMSEAVMSKAHVKTAAGLAACLGGDADNVFVTLTARGMSDQLLIIARSEHQETEPKLKRAGADRVICPPLLGANRITQMLLTPAVEELLDIAVTGSEIEVSKVRLEDLPKLIGKTLRDADVRGRTGLVIVAVVHADGQRVFDPTPDDRMKKEDELIVVGPTGGVRELVKMYGQK